MRKTQRHPAEPIDENTGVHCENHQGVPIKISRNCRSRRAGCELSGLAMLCDLKSPQIHVGSRRLRACVVILLALAGCGSTIPAAQRRATVVLWTTAPLEHLSRRASRQRLDLRVVDVRRALRRRLQSARSPQRASDRLPVALRLAKAAYRQLRFGDAIARLQHAQRLLVRQADAPADYAALGTVAFLLGLNHLALKKTDAAAESMQLALVLRQARFDAGAYPPQVERFLSRLAQQTSVAPAIVWRIAATPAVANLWVDGRHRGQTPLNIEVKPGPHHVRLEALGHASTGVLRNVSAAAPIPLKVSLKHLASVELARQLLQKLESEGALPDDPELLARAMPQTPPAAQVDGIAWLAPPTAARPHHLHWFGRATPPAGRVASVACPAERGTDADSDCICRNLYRLSTGHDPRPVVAARPLYRR